MLQTPGKLFTVPWNDHPDVITTLHDWCAYERNEVWKQNEYTCNNTTVEDYCRPMCKRMEKGERPLQLSDPSDSSMHLKHPRDVPNYSHNSLDYEQSHNGFKGVAEEHSRPYRAFKRHNGFKGVAEEHFRPYRPDSSNESQHIAFKRREHLIDDRDFTAKLPTEAHMGEMRGRAYEWQNEKRNHPSHMASIRERNYPSLMASKI